MAVVDAGHVVILERAHAESQDFFEGREFLEPFGAVEVGAEEFAAVLPVALRDGFAEDAVFGLVEEDGTGGGLRAHCELI